MLNLLQNRYSFIAGAFAAGGSFFGKLPSFLIALKFVNAQNASALHTYAEFLAFRCVPIALMVVCNVLNWRYFMKAMQCSEQTLMATVLTASSNYMVSFLLGFVVYGEPVTLLSAVGVSLMLAGLWFICGAQELSDATDTTLKATEKKER